MPSAVDTNVLVRFIVDDGSKHIAAARRVFAQEQVFVSLSVMLETEWVLRSNFGFKRVQICDAFDRVLGYEAVTFQERQAIEDAVDACRAGMDFADALHLNAAVKCDVFFTFDKKLVRQAKKDIPIPKAREP
jgi:predicted nucleic-acid-binding protein